VADTTKQPVQIALSNPKDTSAWSDLQLAEEAQKRGMAISISSPPDEKDQHEKRLKNRVVLGFAVVAALVALGVCIAMMFRGGSSAEDRKWAQSMLFMIVGGALGYLGAKGQS
jgi:ABC-type Na+ efflux pump permease subunit